MGRVKEREKFLEYVGINLSTKQLERIDRIIEISILWNNRSQLIRYFIDSQLPIIESEIEQEKK